MAPEVKELLSKEGYGPDGNRYLWEEDMPHCQNCRAVSFNLAPLQGDQTAMACPRCRDEAYQVLLQAILDGEEPECTCRRSDVDLFDARGCDVHDPNSPW